ncbi:hypothetical protein [Streptomyces palmae]|uniref:Uncharacterized protein n=1 Tax=Streptomyces palmae TaxID=1701085 RepID=A0A4Z0HB51_9ACTN|nr:hypothetical protein [Streptomyces palmae]TGB16163.1 hypothetical protein E4099_05770 [Streptomyces palmae]
MVVAGALWGQEDTADHLADNRSQLARSCKGSLPYQDLRAVVPGDREGRLYEYGTMLTPGQQSRSLLHCSVDWGEGRRIMVRAVALVSDVPQRVRAEELLDVGAQGTYAAPGITGQYQPRSGAWLVTECVNGLSGRARSSTDLYVSATVDRGAGHRKGPSDALAAFRTAVEVANAVSLGQQCGGTPLHRPERVVPVAKSSDGPKPAGGRRTPCDWLGPRTVPGLRGSWASAGDQQGSPLVNGCRGTLTAPTGGPRAPRPWQVTEADAVSWSGTLARTAYHAYQDGGLVPGWGRDPDEARGGAGGGAGVPAQGQAGETRIPSYADDPRLALWARSVCDRGPTYHRVSVAPRVEFAGGDEAVLAAPERQRLSTTARALLDAYLSAPGGWPRAQHCHDTTVLGEAEEWH